ncbi:MAG: hypothetical protein O7H41_19225 [Planctomycetota bacterium]|nr:hypothetical protein [Planctomycetota bacterium]
MRNICERSWMAWGALFLVFLWGCPGGSSSRGGGGSSIPPDIYELNNSAAACSSIFLDPTPEATFFEGDLTLHNAFDEDYFCVRLTQDAAITITVSFVHDNGDVDVALLNSLQQEIYASRTQQDYEAVLANVTAGDYFVWIYSPTQETNLYTLDIRAQSAGGPIVPDVFEPDSDNFCGPTGVNLGDLGNNTFSATNLTTHDANDIDYYCFDVSAVATMDISIVFFHSVGNLDMALLDASQGVLIESMTVGDEERVTKVLPPGTYAVFVYGVAGAINRYQMRIAGVLGGGLAPDTFEPNDDPTTVCSGGPAYLGDLSGIATVPTFQNSQPLTIDTDLDEDYYCFTLTRDASIAVDISFLHVDGNLGLRLLDSAQNVLGFSNGFADGERVIRDVVAGDYIVYVFTENDPNTYDLMINVFEPDLLEVNDDPATAAVVAAPGMQSALTIHNSFDEDWFQFTLGGAVDATVTMDIFFQHFIGDLDMDLYDTGLNLVLFAASRSDDEQIVAILSPGTFYIRVFGFQAAMNGYDLDITVVPGGGGLSPDRYEPNNTFTSGTNVGSPVFDSSAGGAMPLTIHNSADSDFFLFSMNGTGNRTVTITLTFDGTIGDLDVEIYVDPINPRLIARGESGGSDEILTTIIPAGPAYTYAVRAYGFNGDMNTYHILIEDVNGGGLSPDGWESNDDFASPNPIWLTQGDFPGTPVVGRTIHNALDLDYIQFAVDTPKSVQVNLTFVVDYAANPDNGNDLDMAILDDNDNVILLANTADSNETATLNIADGIDYRIVVFGFLGAVNTYTFEISDSAPVPPGPDAFEPNNNDMEASFIPLPFALTTLSIHDPGTPDFYQVTLQSPDLLTAKISFTHALGDLDLELLDSNLMVIATSATTENIEEIAESIVPGDYFIRVYAAGVSANNYRLDIFTAAGAGGLLSDVYEYNSDLNSCTPIILNFSETKLSLHSAFDVDYYCFTLGNTRRVTVSLRFIHALGDVDVSLWCLSGGGRSGPGSPPCGNTIVGSSSSTDDNELIDDGSGRGISLAAGEYYVLVEGAGGASNAYEMYVTTN